ncbi:pyridoxamine 5'-phosphate oxidase family protein [Blastococcus sp. MG754426]|uniref:pyridoxamine 5'-phosphate oxidase family protein n=1 Tax=unclassified Blastococcus TaxID=2619396 RepID=UPI001EEF8193|nr:MULTISPECIES: pyridoxamine 5'-phosphate oxidase family protein [unclassified Blastococcus]MCF6507730.1 pyridoxamine 5'-phosphate oxidase family protein [Blastococcus sp. MG754426]MCF6512276.1 pyridoxamine 5'-phosphate oxidase family protein [Blastococcus sp. MG754427]MCF6735282.1 pyridoxamine 5'-phosphate oxidase family protein [Blastococcus sp. KM273129]
MDSAAPLSPTARSTVRRGAKRARTDRTDLHAVLDAGLVGHLGVLLGQAPVVLPTGYGRRGDTLYLHGSTGAATLRAAAAGAPVCFTVTHLDGIVYARSAFHHSVNYRCAVVHGAARPVTDPDERLLALEVLTEHLAPGSWAATRRPDRKELAATAVLALDLAEASVKIRTGPPGDDERDLAGPVWAGVLPVRTVLGEPEPCPLLPPGAAVPPRVADRALSPAG